MFKKEYLAVKAKKSKDLSDEQLKEMKLDKESILDDGVKFDDVVGKVEEALKPSESKEQPVEQAEEEVSNDADKWAENAAKQFTATGTLPPVFKQEKAEEPVRVQKFQKISYDQKSATDNGSNSWIDSKLMMLRKRGLLD